MFSTAARLSSVRTKGIQIYILLSIIGLLKHSKADSSADSFMPLLIYAVLHANPEHLVSNVQYILRFRNQEKLGGEAGYYLSSLVSEYFKLFLLFQVLLTSSSSELSSLSKTWIEPALLYLMRTLRRMWKRLFQPLPRNIKQN